MSNAILSAGALGRILNGEDVHEPILQILAFEGLLDAHSGHNYKLTISDGQNFINDTILSNSLNYTLDKECMPVYSVFRLIRYAMCQYIENGRKQRAIMIFEIQRLMNGGEVKQKMGNLVAELETRLIVNKPINEPITTEIENPILKMESSNVEITNVAALSPYLKSWVFKVRVTNKILSVNGDILLDVHDKTGEIRYILQEAVHATFKETFKHIHVGEVYYIAGGKLMPADPKFNRLKNNYEIHVDRTLKVYECLSNTKEIPFMKCQFVLIRDLIALCQDETVDILGIVKSSADVILVCQSASYSLIKRKFCLVDESNTMVTVTLWGSHAGHFKSKENSIIAIKGAVVEKNNTVTNLSCGIGTRIEFNPDYPEVHKLRGWFLKQKIINVTRSVSCFADCPHVKRQPWATFREIDLCFALGICSDTFFVKATISAIDIKNCMHKLCPEIRCRNKLNSIDDITYHCRKCDKKTLKYVNSLTTSVLLSDWSGNKVVRVNNEHCEYIFGMKVNGLVRLSECNYAMYLNVLKAALYKSYIFKIQFGMDHSNGQIKIMNNIVTMRPVDAKSYNLQLLRKIMKLRST